MLKRLVETGKEGPLVVQENMMVMMMAMMMMGERQFEDEGRGKNR